MNPIVYDYVVVDTKLMAMNNFHRYQHPITMLNVLMNALKFNNIKFKEIVWAYDLEKSNFRLTLQSDYKGHRQKLHDKKSDEERKRKEIFDEEYKKLPKLLKYIGKNAQNYGSGIEADDIPNLVRELKPTANILMVGEDMDWFTQVQSGEVNVHLLKYSKNQMFRTPEDVANKYELSGQDLIYRDAAIGQGKDNILNLKNFGKARFMEHLYPHPVEEWGEIINKFLEEGKWGMYIHPDAKYDNFIDNFHHNLLLMSPMGITNHKVENIEWLNNELDREQIDIDYEEFLVKGIELYGQVAPITKKDFDMLRKE